MESKLTPGSVFCVIPCQGQGKPAQIMPLACLFVFFFSSFFPLLVLLFKVRIELYLSSVLKYSNGSLQTALKGSQCRFVNTRCRIGYIGQFEKSSWVSRHVCFPQKSYPVLLLLRNKPNMALKSSCSISQPILQPFLFMKGGKKI